MNNSNESSDTELQIMSRLVRGNYSPDDRAKLFALNNMVDTGIATPAQLPSPAHPLAQSLHSGVDTPPCPTAPTGEDHGPVA